MQSFLQRASIRSAVATRLAGLTIQIAPPSPLAFSFGQRHSSTQTKRTKTASERVSDAARMKAKLRSEKIKKGDRAKRELRYRLTENEDGSKSYQVHLTPAQQRRKEIRESLRLAMDDGNTDSVPALVDYLKKTNPNTRRGTKFGMLLDTVTLKGKQMPMGEYMREMDRLALMNDPDAPGVGTYLTEVSELDYDGAGDLESLASTMGQFDDPTANAVSKKMNRRLTGIISGRKVRMSSLITTFVSNVLTQRQISTLKNSSVSGTPSKNNSKNAKTSVGTAAILPSKPLVVGKPDPNKKGGVIEERVGHIDLYSLNWFISRVVVSSDLGHATVYWCAPCLLPSKDADPLHDKNPELLKQVRATFLSPTTATSRLDILTPEEQALVDTVMEASSSQKVLPTGLLEAAGYVEARRSFFSNIRPRFHSSAEGFGIPAKDLRGTPSGRVQHDVTRPGENIADVNRGMTVAQERAIKIVSAHVQKYLDIHIPAIRYKIGRKLEQKFVPNLRFQFDEQYVSSLLREHSLETTLHKMVEEMSPLSKQQYLKKPEKKSILAGLNVPGMGLYHEDGSVTSPQELAIAQEKAAIRATRKSKKYANERIGHDDDDDDGFRTFFAPQTSPIATLEENQLHTPSSSVSKNVKAAVDYDDWDELSSDNDGGFASGFDSEANSDSESDGWDDVSSDETIEEPKR